MYKFIIALVIGCGIIGCDASTSSSPDDFSIKYVGRQRLRDQLKDPDSLEIISEELVRPGANGGEVGYRAKFRAKNGFGGYNVETFYTE
jgi:hypothetical protein